MTTRALEEKRLKRLRDLMSQPDNKRCMDCLEKGPIYLCGTFGTFVCTTCSGVQLSAFFFFFFFFFFLLRGI